MALAIDTPRLWLREFRPDDAAYVLRQLNDADFIEHIADRGVRDLAQARDYLEQGPMRSYARHGFGLWAVQRRSDAAILGMCGLIQRDYLDQPDLGYALLPEFTGQGYALEACAAVLRSARRDFKLAGLSAIVNPGNLRSRQLLGKLQFRESGVITVPGETHPLCLYQHDFTETAKC